ncbi:ER membrane protein complex subunit, partial [Lachnellula subtilissima]
TTSIYCHTKKLAMASVPPPPQWVIDLNSPPAGKPKTAGIPDPPGYTSTGGKKQQSSSKTAVRAPPTTEEMDVLKLKKAWEVALAPVKQLPMTAIMMYMSGNSLQIFSIMMVGMAFKNPIMGLMATNQAFEKFETPGTRGNLLMVKAVYVAMQILALALGVWKVNGMGLLPTTRSDWLAWETARDPLEVAIPAF